MFTRLLSRFASVIYVQIWEGRLKVTNLASNESYDDSALVVIRTTDKGEKLISDSYVGEKLLQHAFKQISNIKYLRPRPNVIIHPMEKTEGGLTMIEKRAFRELALGAGAIEVKLHTGKPLTIKSINFDKFEESEGPYKKQ